MSKYSVWVIDDKPFMVKLIEEICLLTGQFEVRSYDDPVVLLRDIGLRSFNNQEMPDLFVIDLKLEGKQMQGLELISHLSQRKDLRSAIMALSGYVGIDELPEAVDAGADWAAIKPFTDDFVDQLLRCAEIGRKRRLYDSTAGFDSSRNERSVFLSYSAEDNKAANRVRRNLEARGIDVWYAPDTLKPGDVWREQIRLGLTQANVLVALITQAYVSSPICKAELASFLRRVRSESPDPPMLIPVLFECTPNALMQDELTKQCLKHQYITMSAASSVDALTHICWTIKLFLNHTSPHN